MIRTFATHNIRKQQELTGSLWEFTPCQGEKKGNRYQVATACCWENHPEFTNYRGEGEYSRTFIAEGTIRLEFKGVSHTATVFLDGKEIASHYNAYTMFYVIVKDLPKAEHVLTIRADNRFSENSALHIPNDYMSYGGLSEEDMRNKNFESQAEKVIEEMILSHYNHPSIYIWGILNECASDSEYGRGCYQRQFELIRRLDTSRPHSFASCKFKTDLSFGLPDVVSYNIYPLWYHNTDPEEYLDDLYQWVQKETEGSKKPFMITEIGAGGIYGYRNPYHSKWTEEYQAETLERQITAVCNYPDCIGVYIWQFCDIRVSDEWFHVRPRTMNNKGIVDEFRRPKLCYEVVKRLFEKISVESK